MHLRIRQAQLDTFSAVRAERLIHRVVARLQRDWPPMRGKPDPEALIGLVADAIETARGLGASVERDLMRFVLLTVAIGPGFTEDSSLDWVQAIVTDDALDGALKIDLLADGLADHLRATEP